MRAAASSKNPKKNSVDDDRIKRRKIKSGKRRRRDPSPSYSSSSYSLSSDSEEDSRSRRKKSRRETKKRGRKRKELSKKSDKRKGRRERSRRDPSVSSSGSYSSWSCSTCQGSSSESDRSRSPARRADRRVKSSPRGRSKARGKERERERERMGKYRSRSCSPGSRRDLDSCRSRSHSEEKFKEDQQKRLKSALAVDKSEEFDDRYCGGDDDRYCGGDDDRYCGRDDDRDKIINAYDDVPSSGRNDSYEALDKRVEVENSYSALVEDGAHTKGEGVVSSERSTLPTKNSDGGRDDPIASEYGSIRDAMVSKESEVVSNDGSKEADDLELILRQKALENLRKFRGGICANKGIIDERKDENVKSESYQRIKSVVETPESTPTSGSNPNEEHTDGSLANPVPRESIVMRPIEKSSENPSPILSPLKDNKNTREGQKTANQLNRLQKSSGKVSSELISSPKDIQNTKTDAGSSNSKSHQAEVSIPDGSASGTICPDAENENCKIDKPVVESTGGSQFEQKTFSRFRDGETVQVSYKVYIPKKTPALARRQLQR